MKRALYIFPCLVLLFAGCNKDENSVLKKDVSENSNSSIPGQSNKKVSVNENSIKATDKNQESYELNRETEHFKIYSTLRDKECLKDLSEGLESAYSKVTVDLDCKLDSKVDVTVYPDIELLHKAIGYVDGTGQDYYITAGTIGNHIYITSPLNPGPVRDYEHLVKSSPLHEFTHVVINKITSSDTWPTNVPRWLNEGIASYEGGPPMPMNIMIQQVSLGVRSNKIPSFASLASYGQDFITSGGYFFTLPAGKFFVEEYGFEKVKRLIESPNDFKTIIGKSEETVWNEWVEYLKKDYK